MKYLLVLISTLVAFSATALGHTNGGKPAVNTKKVLQLRDLSEMLDLNQLTDAELDMLQNKLDTANSMPQNMNMVASLEDDASIIYTGYLCTGGKAALGIVGKQGFKCINLRNAEFVTVTYAAGANTGIVGAEDYVGFNGGGGVFAGFILHTCEANNNCEIRGQFGSEELKGVTLGGAWWFLGALGGYYVNQTNSLYLLGWQMGASAEISASTLFVE